MYCQNCGKETTLKDKFCGSCGAELAKEKKQDNDRDSNDELVSIGVKIARVIEVVIYFAIMFIAYIALQLVLSSHDLSVQRPFYIIVGSAIAAITIGHYIGKWYANKKNKKVVVVRVIGFLNLIAWLFPPLGFLIYSLTINFVAEKAAPQWYRLLYLVGLLLSCGNAYYGFWLTLPD
ncbi:MAG: zinc-ribbon domain-containing protein [Patescibacteria group bacterium]|jgi:hypothetical protein